MSYVDGWFLYCVILIVIIDQVCEFINKSLSALLCGILTKTAVFIPDARLVFYDNE